MTPLGYLRKVEHFMVFLRDNPNMCDLEVSEEGKKLLDAMNKHAEQIDQAWSELSHDDQLMVYNITKHIYHNVKPAPMHQKPESSVIQLLN